MKRYQADILLGIAGLIWGFGFVAQKDALDYIGPSTFIACKFLISSLFVLPFLWAEMRKSNPVAVLKTSITPILSLCGVFVAAVLTQQYGMKVVTATNTAFITGLYVVLVPVCGFILYRREVTFVVLIASVLSVVGIGLLTGGDATALMGNLTWSDGLILVCAVFFGFQVSMMGHVVSATKMPILLSFLQYFMAGIVALVLALMFETIDLRAIGHAWVPILYSGIAAGGIAYTLQAIAQQHTPPTDTGIISGCGECLFGALGAAWLLHERITVTGYWGCAVILASIILVELVPLMHKKPA